MHLDATRGCFPTGRKGHSYSDNSNRCLRLGTCYEAGFVARGARLIRNGLDRVGVCDNFVSYIVFITLHIQIVLFFSLLKVASVR